METFYCFNCKEYGSTVCSECGELSCDRCDHPVKHCLRRLRARLEKLENYVERLKEVAQG